MSLHQAFALPFVLLAGLFAPPVDGTWTGSLPVPGKPLRLVFHLTKSGGTVDSPDQHTNGIPITGISTSGSSVQVSVKSIGGTYSGNLNKSGNEMTGEWKQGATLPLTVTRPKGSAASAEGRWEGPLQTPQGRIRIVYNVKKSGAGYAGTADSPDQKVNGIPLKSISLKAGSLSIMCEAMHATFNGKLSRDGKSATGEFWQGSALPLTLKRSR